MVTRRVWTAQEFERYFVGHPLLWQLVRRLRRLAEADGTATVFPAAEDRTLSDIGDETFTLASTGLITGPTFAELDPVTASEVIADLIELTAP